MSKRRSISFSENELILLNYFDENGKSDLAKDALLFYKENKDNVITDSMIKILKAIVVNNKQIEHPISPMLQDKMSKLKK
jgi:hypothetical protein